MSSDDFMIVLWVAIPTLSPAGTFIFGLARTTRSLMEPASALMVRLKPWLGLC